MTFQRWPNRIVCVNDAYTHCKTQKNKPHKQQNSFQTLFLIVFWHLSPSKRRQNTQSKTKQIYSKEKATHKMLDCNYKSLN